MKYYYRIYGLNIRSEVKFEETDESKAGKCEVDIRYGAIPKHIRKYRKSKDVKCLVSNEYKWFQYDKTGEFYIENGDRIIIAADNNADAKLIRSIILGPCMGSILYQRRILSIHGSAMVRNDKAIIISGKSGAGKSTISSALRKHGWSFLADDTVAITDEEDCFYANPAYPQQKLCLDTAEEFGYDLEQLTVINEERQKYAVNVKDSFCSEPKQIIGMVCLEINNSDQLEIEEVKGNDKVGYIINNLYAYHDVQYMGMSTLNFKKCLAITQKVPVLRVKRPQRLYTVDQIIEYIEHYIENT